MSPHVSERRSRRDALIARCEAQRRQLAGAAQAFKPAAHAIDGALGVARYLRAHPLLISAGIVATIVASRGRLLRWLGATLPVVSLGLRAIAAMRKP